MNEILLTVALLAVSSTAIAGSGSKGSEQPPANVVHWTPATRVFHYGYDRNSLTADGLILVCPGRFRAAFANDECTDNGKNAWQQLVWTIPKGYKVTSIEYRFTGSGGYRVLTVYMDPAE